MNNSIQDIDKIAIDRVKNVLSCCSNDCHEECKLFDGSRSPTGNNCNAHLLIQMFKEGADWALSNKQPSQHNWNEISQNPNLNEWILVEYISNEIIYEECMNLLGAGKDKENLYYEIKTSFTNKGNNLNIRQIRLWQNIDYYYCFFICF